MRVLTRIPLLKKANQALVNRLVAESLEKNNDIQDQKLKLLEQKHKKEIRDMERNHLITFQQYKKEQEKLVAQIMGRADDMKREAEEENRKAREIHREAMVIKEKFSRLLFKVKTLYGGIDSIMKSTVVAETEITTLIAEVEKDMSFRHLEMEPDNKVKTLKSASHLSLS